MAEPSPPVVAHLQPLFKGVRPLRWLRVDRGYTPAERWLLWLKDKRRAFIKVGDDTIRPGAAHTTAEGLRREHAVYSRLSATFLPALLLWVDQPNLTILALEDLSHAFWPPPWNQARVDVMRRMLDEVHATKLPGLPPSSAIAAADEIPALWRSVAADRAAFLSLGLCSEAWLDAALPALLEAESQVSLAGDDLCHFDVRSDNMCIENDFGVLIDWNWASIGNGTLDTAFWLPSLHAEGGPAPETILPGSPQYAAFVSGFFAARAGLPIYEWGPHIREVQLSQLRTALPWAQRALDLPPLDPPSD